MEKMDIEQAPAGVPGITVVRLKGPLTISTLFEFQAALREPAIEGVIVDLSSVPYMDSAGLGVLLGHWTHTQRAGVGFALVGISPRVHTIFEITHTDSVLPIFPKQADAERAMSGVSA